MEINANLTSGAFSITRANALAASESQRVFADELSALVAGKHVVIVGGDAGMSQHPGALHAAAVNELQNLMGVNSGADLVVIADGTDDGIDEIYLAARKLQIPVVRVDLLASTRTQREGETVLSADDFGWGGTAESRPDTPPALRATILSCIGSEADAKSMLLFGDGPDICDWALTGKDSGFSATVFQGAVPPANSRDAALFSVAAQRLRDAGVDVLGTNMSPLAFRLSNDLKDKTTFAFVTYESNDYMPTEDYSSVMFKVAEKLGIRDQNVTPNVMIICRQDGSAAQRPAPLTFAHELGYPSLYLYSGDKVLDANWFSDERRQMISMKEYPRKRNNNAVGTVCSEVLEIASQVNAGAKQVMVILGGGGNAVEDAHTAVSKGHRVIVVENCFPLPPAGNEGSAFREYMNFYLHREGMRDAGVEFYPNAEAIGDDLRPS